MSTTPLTRPDGTDPDGFSQRIAAAYTTLVATTFAPAKAIADEAGVPIATAHRWIREARQRGHLPPARKGAAGPDPWQLIAADLGVPVQRLRDAVARHTRSGLRRPT